MLLSTAGRHGQTSSIWSAVQLGPFSLFPRFFVRIRTWGGQSVFFTVHLCPTMRNNLGPPLKSMIDCSPHCGRIKRPRTAVFVREGLFHRKSWYIRHKWVFWKIFLEGAKIRCWQRVRFSNISWVESYYSKLNFSTNILECSRFWRKLFCDFESDNNFEIQIW